ncbi:NUDIX domain-containing protein [uncultured Gimesia sp.]|uniref:(deoxy)nucleoside triphosphate pyrophosphohydrolase n=1 Tax=uncultured Gimesia sp. TaxID=1678688 RepID=UPI0030D96616|tara:strand:+ start:9407 stop:9820 length:414 start_codon:yes stop_codon:yes gene_type:complete
MDSRKTNRIGIAVVEHQRQFLIGVRPAGAALAGCHEFPGGKCQAEETAEACAVRECWEETGLEVIALNEILYEEHSYDHADVKLHFWLCRPKQREADLIARNLQGFHWFPAESLTKLQFPEANARLIELLVSSYTVS